MTVPIVPEPIVPVTEPSADPAILPSTEPEPVGTVTVAEYESIKKRMQAADRRSSELEAQEKARIAATQSETERLTAERDELKKNQEAAADELKRLRIHNAFLASNTHAWANPEIALKLADLSEVTIDESGKVDAAALKKALDALAKKEPYLVKEAGDGAGKLPVGASAPEMNGTPKGGGTGSPDRAALAKRFPVLGQFS